MSFIKPRPDDLVHLIFVTHGNFVYGYYSTRQSASDMMRSWYRAREAIRTKGEGWKEAECFLKSWTFALNLADKENREFDFAQAVVGWEHVVGMYIREIEIVPGDEWKSGGNE